MEKRIWSKPEMNEFAFAANEYVAACWKINCNVEWGFGFIDNNGNKLWDKVIDRLLTPWKKEWDWGKLDYVDTDTPENVHGCGEWHKGVEGVPDDGPEANAVWSPANGGDNYDVYYWRDGNGALDVHFSKAEDAQWETNPNAS